MTGYPDAQETTQGISLNKERDLCWERVRRFMDERGLDGLLVFASDKLGLDHYLTNDRPGQHLIFPRHGKMVSIAFSAQVPAQNMTSAERGENTWLEDVRIGLGGDNVVKLLREKGLENKRVGVVGTGELGTSFMREGWVPYPTWMAIKEALPTTTFENVTLGFVLLMLERSPRDIACLRKAAASGEEACKAMIEATRAGATELDVYNAGICAIHQAGAQATGMILTSGPDNTAWGPSTWVYREEKPRVLREGDIVMVELFPRCAGMEAQQQLSIAIGNVHPNHETCATAARKSYELGLEAIKPGVKFSEVSEIMEAPVREIGGWHITPHLHTMNPHSHTDSVGVDLEKQVPELARRFPTIQGRGRVGGDFELKPGMTLSVQPNAQLGRHRVNIGGTVVVTETGAEELNFIPNFLQRVPGRGR
jgi:Xaa-Pro aminopeptidase